MPPEDVGGVAIPVTIDRSGWSAGVAAMKADVVAITKMAGTLNFGFSAPRGRAAAGAGPAGLPIETTLQVNQRAVRDLRTDINERFRTMASQGGAVSVPVRLGRIPYAQLRTELSQGIGEVPIRVAISSVAGSSRSALQALISTSSGVSMGKAQATIESAAASRGIPRRAMGGPIGPSGALVGERGPEWIETRGSGGTVYPMNRGGWMRHMASGGHTGSLTMDQRAFADNLRTAAKNLTAEQIEFGKAWYPNAGRWIHQQATAHGLPEPRVRGAAAAFSAATSWSGNKTKLLRSLAALSSGQPFPYPGGLRADRLAERILVGGEPPESVIGHMPKVGQFYRNLGGDLSALTLDRWALRTATRGALERIGPTNPMRSQIDAAYRQVAAELGLHPKEFQAATWAMEKQSASYSQAGGKNLARFMAQGGPVRQLEAMFPNAKVDLGRFSGKALKEIAESAAPLAERYPLTSALMAQLGIGNTEGRSGLIARMQSSPWWVPPNQGLWDKGGHSGHRIMFQNRATRMTPGLRASLGRDTLDSSLGGVFRHEFGHAVDYTHGTFPRGGMIPRDDDSWVPGQTIQPVSKYAQTDSGERFAEGFSAAEMGRYPDLLRYLEHLVAREQGSMRRAQGGPAKKGGLPRGYRMEFIAPMEGEEGFHQTVVGGIIPTYVKKIQKPELKPGNVPGDIMAVIRNRAGDAVGTFPFTFDEHYGALHPEMSWTDPRHRRKGLATAAYVKAERFTGREVMPSESQLPPGRALWSQKERPFGRSFGRRPMTETDTQRLWADEHPALRFVGQSSAAEAMTHSTNPQGPLGRRIAERAATQDIVSDALVQWRTIRMTQLRERGMGLREAARAISEEESMGYAPMTAGDMANRRRARGGYVPKLPPEPGTSPVEPGLVRAFHYTRPDRLGKILHEGLSTRHALGHTYGEPDEIWMSAEQPSREHSFVEAHVSPLEMSIGHPAGQRDPESLRKHAEWMMGRGANFTLQSSEFPASRFVTHNRPWHGNFRYLMENYPPGSITEDAAREQFDWALKPGPAGEVQGLRHAVVRWLREVRAAHRAAGGDTTKGKYIVNELGKELFVPAASAGLIPKDVMAQLPKRAGGGPAEIDGHGPRMWEAPEDGWIIPAHLKNKVPHRQAGGDVDITSGSGFGSEQYFEDERRRRTNERRARAAARRGVSVPVDAASNSTFVGPEYPETIGPGQRVGSLGIRSSATGAPAGLGVIDAWAAQAAKALEGSNRVLGRIDTGLAEVRRESAIQQRGISPRSVVAATGRFLFGGGREQQEAIALASRASQELRSIGTAIGNVEDPVGELNRRFTTTSATAEGFSDKIRNLEQSGKTGTRQFKDLSDKLYSTRQALRVITPALEHATDVERVRAEAISRAQLTPSSFVRSFATVQAATVGYQAALSAINFAMDAGAPAIGAVVDQMTGFTAVSGKVTSSIGEQIRAQHGNVDATFAQTAAVAGLSDAASRFIQGQLGPTAIAKAGAVTGTQTADLFRATLGTGQEPRGLYGGYGGIGGGGLFAQQLGGGAGLAEVIRDSLGLFGTVVAKGQVAPPGSRGRPIAPIGGGGTGSPTPKPADVLQGQVAREAETQYIDTFNDAAKRAAVYLGETADSAYRFVQVDPLGQFSKNVQSSHLPDELKGIARQGYVLEDAQGHLLTNVSDTNKALEQMSQGLQIATPASFARQQAQGLRAQEQATGVRAELERNVIIPGQFAQQRIAQPFTPAATGIVTSALSEAERRSLKGVDEIQRQIMDDARAAIGQQAETISQNINPQAADEFTGLMKSVAGIGQEIAGIQAQIGGSQERLAAHQYGQQLFLINRAISDAKGLITGQGGGSNLGALQREQFDLARASQRLQLQLSQRQINFQVAVAGFTAPGLTGQERAARIREAELEAEYAQRQQNIAKKQYGVEGQVFNVGAVRNLADLERQRALVAESFHVSQEELVANRRIAALGERQAQLQARAQSIFAQATGNFDGRLGQAAQYVAMFGGTVAAATKAIREALGLKSEGGGGSGGKTGKRYLAQTGILGTVSRPTEVTFGEAGTETAAILRNPRRGTLAGIGMGGGQAIQINVTVTGNQINNAMDLDHLARTMAEQVEIRLGRKAALLGVRAPVG